MKKPVLITVAIIGVLIALLITILCIRSCKRADDLLPTSESTTYGSDGSSGLTNATDANGSEITADPGNPDSTSPAAASDGSDQILPTEEGEIIITIPATTTTTAASAAGNTTAASSQDTTSATSGNTASTETTGDGVIELPFVPADAL